MTPVVNRLAPTIMGPSKDATVLTDGLSVGDDEDAVGINAQTDWAVGEGRRHAVAVALQMDEASRRNAFGVLDEAVERSRHSHQMLDFLGPNVGDRAGLRSVRRHSPQLPALFLQPVVERIQGREARHGLPKPMTGVLHVLLDLPLLPTGGWIAELSLEKIMADHGRETDVDLSLLAAADLVDGSLHVILDAALRHSTQDAERVDMSVEQHLVGL